MHGHSAPIIVNRNESHKGASTGELVLEMQDQTLRHTLWMGVTAAWTDRVYELRQTLWQPEARYPSTVLLWFEPYV